MVALSAVDPFRFTTLAHATHEFCNPVGAATLDRLVGSLDLAPGARILDAGCGKGELLIRVAARWKAEGTGVDVNPAFLADARRRAAARGVRLTLIESPMAEAALPPASFDATLCVGSTHVFGDLGQALAGLRDLTRPGGRILLGHGHWMREPDPEYLASFGGTRDELATLDETLATIRAARLDVLECAETSLADWDAYEGRYAENIEAFFAAHPDDPDREAFLERSRRWRATYERWGRGTMGFAMVSLRRTAG